MSKQSSSALSSRVISLNGLGRGRSPGHRILCDCREQLSSLLASWLREAAAPVAEELFLLADSTRDRVQQTRYLDLRAEIEKSWPHFVETFKRNFEQESENCQNSEAQDDAESTTSQLDIPDFEGLQLVDDDSLTSHIVLREFSAQLSESCDEELYTLDRRVAALLGHGEVSDNTNPFTPSVVFQALFNASATIAEDFDSRLVLLRRLERQLHRELPELYRQTNGYLIERGILPELKRTFARSQTPTSTGLTTNTTPQPQNIGNFPNALPPSEGILAALQRLATLRTMPGTTTVVSTEASPVTPATMAMMDSTASLAAFEPLLLHSLTALQHAAPTDVGSQPQLINQVRVVRESEAGQRIGGLESVTIDVVAMLFDFIFDDKHIPLAIKALLSRLQIPVLKVAMLNPGFFADRQHPTRRFLSRISGISIRWGDAVDESDPFYKKLEELVAAIQAEFESDIEVFGRALATLEVFMKERESQESLSTEAAAKLVMQQERASEAKERSEKVLRDLFEAGPVPKFLRAVLSEHWVKVLQLADMESSANEQAWQESVTTMHELVWSIIPKKGSDERLRLVSLLPKLLGALNKGLDKTGIEKAQRQKFFDTLMQHHASALRGDTPISCESESSLLPDALSPLSPLAGTEQVVVTHNQQDGIEVEEITLIDATPIWRPDDQETFRQVNELKRGAWVEFTDEQGKTTRERLNWISPRRGVLLFSNHHAAKAISITPEALVKQIKNQKARILREEAIFERALDGALLSLDAANSTQ